MHTPPEILHKTPQLRISDDVHFSGGGFFRAPQGHVFPLHRHTHWEFVYYRSGFVRCLIADQWFEARPGTMLLTPPHTWHQDVGVSNYENVYLAVEARVDAAWPLQVFDDIECSMGRVCEMLARESNIELQRRYEMLDLLLQQLLILVERRADETLLSNSERAVRDAERVLDDRHAQSPSITQVAREVGVSASYLREQFMAHRQKTPRQHLQNARLRHALSLLRGSSLTLEHIAQICGYHSASHLSRHVKSAMGKTPGALRVLDMAEVKRSHNT